jgi:hypothetical protein
MWKADWFTTEGTEDVEGFCGMGLWVGLSAAG